MLVHGAVAVEHEPVIAVPPDPDVVVPADRLFVQEEADVLAQDLNL